MSLERRKRVSSGWFDTEDVPALRLEAVDVAPGETVRIMATTDAAFRGLELEVETGKDEFDVHSLAVDGEPQLLIDEPIAAAFLDDNSLHFPFTAEDGEMVMVVRNVSTGAKTFRAFVLGRLRDQWEKSA